MKLSKNISRNVILSKYLINNFKKKVYSFYRKNKRDLPWRDEKDPYKILVSEVMLQQTQVERVKIKYIQFIKAFPSFGSLANATLQRVLAVWQGMGYNRRALFLKKTAETVVKDFNNKLPNNIDSLTKLQGIGKHTAASICAYAFNQPTVFIETNIRTVFIHEFFKDKHAVHDSALLPLVEKTLDRQNPSKWYNALMDFGTMLKERYPNPSRKSVHYVRQSRFEGSNRQVRGAVLKLLTFKPMSDREIQKHSGLAFGKIAENIQKLKTEGFIKEKREKFAII